MVNLEILRDLLRKERRSNELTELEDNFYNKAGKYIRDIEDSIKKEKNKNKELMLKDEKDSAKKLLNKLFERRTGKILSIASLNIKGLDIDKNKMTTEEKNIFDSLTNELKKGRKEVKQKIHSKNQNNKKTNKEVKNKKENFNKSKKPFTVVRVLENFPKFIGSDEKSHHLSKEDIVALPKEDADVLIEKDVAEEIKGDKNENA